MPCSRCYDKGYYTAILGRPSSRHGNKEERMCSCEMGIELRWPLLTRQEIAERGLDVELWRTDPKPKNQD